LAKNLWIGFVDGQQIMAEAAVIAQRLPILRNLTAVVTAEAARIIHVPDVVRVGSPGHLHAGKDIALVDDD
jgi:hypothetical protein